jgi:GT2 family glycosyltransferase
VIRISVVIPHYDDLDQLARCLDLLDRQTLARDSFEVIVSDNNSRCGLEAVRRVAAGRAQVVLASEPGAGPARNEGARVAAGTALAFIDSDCRPTADWLSEGLAGLERHPIVGGPVIMEPANPASPTPEEAFDVVFGFNALEFLKTRGFIGSGNLFVRREVFDSVGGFRSGVSEDVEWSHRAADSGFSLQHVPGAVVGHPARKGWDDLVRTWNRRTREAYLLAREQPSGRLRWVLQACLVLISPLPHIVKVLRSPYLSGWRDRWGAIRVLFRIRLHRFVQSLRIMRIVESDAAFAGTAPGPVRPQSAPQSDNVHD